MVRASVLRVWLGPCARGVVTGVVTGVARGVVRADVR